MATPGAYSVSAGCGVRAVSNQQIPRRFKIKTTEGDYGSVSSVVVHVRQVRRALGFESRHAAPLSKDRPLDESPLGGRDGTTRVLIVEDDDIIEKSSVMSCRGIDRRPQLWRWQPCSVSS
jgi:hypothetical protein